MLHRRAVTTGALLGLVGLAASAVPARPVPSTPPPGGGAGCRVILVGHGTYRLSVRTGGPVPVVDFQAASGPTFDPISWAPSPSAAARQCDKSMGALKVEPSRNATPLLYHVATELYAQARVEYQSSQRSQFAWPYRDFGNMLIGVQQQTLLAGFRQGAAAIAADLIKRYANPAGYLTDKGAQWIAEQAVKLMMQSYVEGRDPGLIIDGLLTDMVGYLQGHVETLAQTVGGDQLKQALTPLLKQIAGDVTKALVEAQPDAQTIQVSAYNATDDCTHFLIIWWNFKGGTYRGMLTVSCGPAPRDVISNVTVTNPSVEPGAAGAVVAQAFSQLKVPFPLQAATVNGVAPVQEAGVGEPAAVLAGATATFNFSAARIRADRDYDFNAVLTTNDVTGRLTGTARGKVTVLNVAPTLLGTNPKQLSAPPGGVLDLGSASLFVIDRNADASNPGEVPPTSLALAHPAGLNATPPFTAVTNPRLADRQPASGMLRFDFDGGTSRVHDPHVSGTFDIGLSAADDQGLSVTGTIPAIVENVAPTVEKVTVTPAFVHQNGSAQIQVRIRVHDANTVVDIRDATIDSRAAASSGGGLAAVAGGLIETGRGEDWIEYELSRPFVQAKLDGQYPIPVAVHDSSHQGTTQGVLHVGNEAPVIGGYGYILDADTVKVADDPTRLHLAPPRGLCPNDHFRAGVITRDPEGDTLDVKGIIVETGAEFPFPDTRGAIRVGDLTAPSKPGHYTLRMLVQERPRDKEAKVEVPLEVIDCGQQQEDDKVALGDPATPSDIATAPRDPAGQSQFALLGGGTVSPTTAAGPPAGPSAVVLLDSLRLVLSGVAGSDQPPIETYILATGGSTGPVGQLFAINRGAATLRLPSRPVVVEPVAITPAIQSRVTDLLQRYVAAGGSPLVIDMYCLEIGRLPPVGGTLLRVVSAEVAAPFQRYTGILDAASRVRAAAGLHPDSDPEEYFHAIRQWALWSAEERFDAKQFTEAFITVTRRTLEGAGEPWNDQVEAAVRDLAPNRWTDVQRVLRDAGFDQP